MRDAVDHVSEYILSSILCQKEAFLISNAGVKKGGDLELFLLCRRRRP